MVLDKVRMDFYFFLRYWIDNATDTGSFNFFLRRYYAVGLQALDKIERRILDFRLFT